ncbi:ANTAR domain-containing protein [Pseudarthrobacter raffinosi]|uniref:ANTAR domain-containing protein n=1 Tax=Pseudarthrobacter raffinosi TaxID=2953651 RepID=UPI00208F6DB8|nr:MULTISPECIES: ANTAR domain-containing protein [unclassified Pseudarthrobacter]MCO4237140.1 ANTAR domain-containing protein [Pseudarthrobacter sp. MDT3-28]MCO4251468.1 ANTAR domain-containing protein [Pseudarthrobacter sp. MDT3-9]
MPQRLPSRQLEVGIVTVTDLRSGERWPSFVEAARREKVLSLLALRMHLEGEASAGMIFYSSRPHGFGRDAMEAAHSLAAEASKGLRLVLRIVSLQETEENLGAAMASRTPTDLALGVIIGQERCSYDDALEWLFRASRTRNVSIRDLAAEIVAAADEPHPVRIHFDH